MHHPLNERKLKSQQNHRCCTVNSKDSSNFQQKIRPIWSRKNRLKSILQDTVQSKIPNFVLLFYNYSAHWAKKFNSFHGRWSIKILPILTIEKTLIKGEFPSRLQSIIWKISTSLNWVCSASCYWIRKAALGTKYRLDYCRLERNLRKNYYHFYAKNPWKESNYHFRPISSTV